MCDICNVSWPCITIDKTQLFITGVSVAKIGSNKGAVTFTERRIHMHQCL